MKPVTVYLLGYNVVQGIGWLYILVQFLSALATGTKITEVYDVISFPVQIFQSLMFMEVIHAILGFVRTPWATAMMQICSRLMLVWPVTYLVPSSHTSFGIAQYVFAWSVTEVIRYSFYACSLLGMQPYFITWARYSFFVILYPVGALGEVITAISALPEIGKRKVLSFEMPNPANISFSFYYFLATFLILYIPFFPQLYLYMFAQRKKVLGGRKEEKKTA